MLIVETSLGPRRRVVRAYNAQNLAHAEISNQKVKQKGVSLDIGAEPTKMEPWPTHATQQNIWAIGVRPVPTVATMVALFDKPLFVIVVRVWLYNVVHNFNWNPESANL